MKSTKERVRLLLEAFPHLRNNDDKLIATIWKGDLRRLGYNVDAVLGLAVLKLYAEGKLTNAESIRRSRAKLQADEPTLRGETYKGRLEEGEEIRHTINNEL